MARYEYAWNLMEYQVFYFPEFRTELQAFEAWAHAHGYSVEQTRNLIADCAVTALISSDLSFAEMLRKVRGTIHANAENSVHPFAAERAKNTN